MTEPAKDFWARADRDLLDRWPKDEAGAPEPAAKLDIRYTFGSLQLLNKSIIGYSINITQRLI